jgi:hypothetical protein
VIDIPFPFYLQDGATAADHALEIQNNMSSFLYRRPKIAQSVFSKGLSISDAFDICER